MAISAPSPRLDGRNARGSMLRVPDRTSRYAISSDRHAPKVFRISDGDPAEILVITSYPPRECGIATYSQDLIKALNNKFSNSMSIKVCALESGRQGYAYPEEVLYTLDTSRATAYRELAGSVNRDQRLKMVLVQHEFGLFHEQEAAFLGLLNELEKPVCVVFHTVLPHPDENLRAKVRAIAASCVSIIVMTKTSADILSTDYALSPSAISVIAHGTHLVPHLSEKSLKAKYGLEGRKVLATFGLLSSGKGIETTIEALPAIVRQCPEVVFLVIGKTHPEVVRNEGEIYRSSLERNVERCALRDNVIFINSYLALPDLLEYLQLTDIYLFTSNDPNQAVSGTFVYAMSCACPIISTPIPHAKEVLTPDTGIIFEFGNSTQLSESVVKLLNDEPLRRNIASNTLQKIVSTAWENSAVAHAMLFERICGGRIVLRYNLPVINLGHIRKLTTDTGMIQFSKINQPDISTGYTLDDNARALIAMCGYFEATDDANALGYIRTFLAFVGFCQRPSGRFSNYIDAEGTVSPQNDCVNLEDSNGRAVWALGYLLSLAEILPARIVSDARAVMARALEGIEYMHSTRAMAFVMKGLYFQRRTAESPERQALMRLFADRLAGMYRHESNGTWEWFESYLTYANSVMPESMLLAWLSTGDGTYRDIAVSSLDFLLSQTFNRNGIEVISNKNWLRRGEVAGHFGEQPIDVAYTVIALGRFYDALRDEKYRRKMDIAFDWFLGNNRLHQIVYNPCTGGCYDGLEEDHVNLNQGLSRRSVTSWRG